MAGCSSIRPPGSRSHSTSTWAAHPPAPSPDKQGGVDKSDPAIFAKATELLGVTPQECIFFDDSVKSCRSAKASGMTVIGVYDPFFEGTKDEMPLVCDRFIRDFGEML